MTLCARQASYVRSRAARSAAMVSWRPKQPLQSGLTAVVLVMPCFAECSTLCASGSAIHDVQLHLKLIVMQSCVRCGHFLHVLHYSPHTPAHLSLCAQTHCSPSASLEAPPADSLLMPCPLSCLCCMPYITLLQWSVGQTRSVWAASCAAVKMCPSATGAAAPPDRPAWPGAARPRAASLAETACASRAQTASTPQQEHLWGSQHP